MEVVIIYHKLLDICNAWLDLPLSFESTAHTHTHTPTVISIRSDHQIDTQGIEDLILNSPDDEQTNKKSVSNP